METPIKSKQYGYKIISINSTSQARAKTYGPPCSFLEGREGNEREKEETGRRKPFGGGQTRGNRAPTRSNRPVYAPAIV
jgi:hypothetical protein